MKKVGQICAVPTKKFKGQCNTLSKAVVAVLTGILTQSPVALASDIDPFDPSSCSGEPMSAQEALSHLNVPAGVLEKGIGRFTIHTRSRDCYAGFPCSAWREGGASFYADSPLGDRHFMSFKLTESKPSLFLKSTGAVYMTYTNNEPRLRLVGDEVSESWGPFWWSTSVISQHIELKGINPIKDYATTGAIVSYEYGPSRGCPNGECEAPRPHPGTSTVEFGGRPLELVGRATNACLRITAATSQLNRDSQNNEFTTKTEMVLFGEFEGFCAGEERCETDSL